MWLHVDGAYGAFACLTERGGEALRGIELADSITLDPHKWLYQPIEVGALLVRDGAALRQASRSPPTTSRTSRRSPVRSTSRTTGSSSRAPAAP